VVGGCRCRSVQLRGYKKAQRRQIKMELLGADPRPHHFAALRDRTFRPTRPCQAPRLPRCSLHFNQSITSLYFTCKGALTACRFVGRYRRCGAHLAASFDEARDGFSTMAVMVMSPSAHVPLHMPMHPCVAIRAACARLRRSRGRRSGMTRSNDRST
jgi:hypothetical protein